MEYGDYQMTTFALKEGTSLEDVKQNKIDVQRGEGLECSFITWRADFIEAVIKGTNLSHVFKPGTKMLIEIEPNPYRK